MINSIWSVDFQDTPTNYLKWKSQFQWCSVTCDRKHATLFNMKKTRDLVACGAATRTLSSVWLCVSAKYKKPFIRNREGLISTPTRLISWWRNKDSLRFPWPPSKEAGDDCLSDCPTRGLAAFSTRYGSIRDSSFLHLMGKSVNHVCLGWQLEKLDLSRQNSTSSWPMI